MTQIQQDDILLEAAIEYGPDYKYSIANGSLGLTLYVYFDNKSLARQFREELPMEYKGLRTVVIYTSRPE
jgi:hypothetical protein